MTNLYQNACFGEHVGHSRSRHAKDQPAARTAPSQLMHSTSICHQCAISLISRRSIPNSESKVQDCSKTAWGVTKQHAVVKVKRVCSIGKCAPSLILRIAMGQSNLIQFDTLDLPGAVLLKVVPNTEDISNGPFAELSLVSSAVQVIISDVLWLQIVSMNDGLQLKNPGDLHKHDTICGNLVVNFWEPIQKFTGHEWIHANLASPSTVPSVCAR